MQWGGQSIFDPVLTELMYTWFCPENGRILDPFAGGSVRGIVAHSLGYKYTGIELRKEQIESNIDQAKTMLEKNNQPEWIEGDSEKVLDVLGNETRKVKISIKYMKQKFHPCEIEYIKNVCHGRCCEGNNGLMVTIHETEKSKYELNDIEIENGFIKDKNNGICPFKNHYLCSIHNDKPMGCRFSPFTLSENNILIVRNRYRLLKCYNTEDAIPIYLAHKWSLEQIFGIEKTKEIIDKIESMDNDFFVDMSSFIYQVITDNDIAKHPERNKQNSGYDFILSCPPYFDLERYSDLPDDLSNMGYEKFLVKYTNIIRKSIGLLKKGCFACFVVGEIRDKKGYYRDFVGDTKRAFIENGALLYNDAILLNSVGSASIRASFQFDSGKKLCKIHQNVLVFKKV